MDRRDDSKIEVLWNASAARVWQITTVGPGEGSRGPEKGKARASSLVKASVRSSVFSLSSLKDLTSGPHPPAYHRCPIIKSLLGRIYFSKSKKAPELNIFFKLYPLMNVY